MGLPREVVAQRQDQNFLYAGPSNTGPGLYNPVKPIGHSPSSLFGSDTTKPRFDQKSNEKEQLE
jgi:hypothetical protein